MTHTANVVQAAPAQRIKIEQHSFIGTVWIGAWLFTVAFLKLGFWKAVLAIFVWPYYIGVALRVTSP
jgi:hypothetical protein